MNSKLRRYVLLAVLLFCTGTTAGRSQDLAQENAGAAAVTKRTLPPAIADGGNDSGAKALDNPLSCMPGHQFSKALSFSGIEITDAQVESLATLRQDLIKSMISPVGHLLGLVIDAKEALGSADLNDEKVHSIFAQIKTEMDTAYTRATDHILAVAHVFTPEQRKKMSIAVDRIGLGSMGVRPETRK